MRSSRPWRMFGPLLAVLLLLAGWSAYWLFASAAARTASAAARQRLAGEGITLACGSETWGGYPFRFEFSCSDPRVTSPQGSAAARQLLVIAQAYKPSHLILLLDGPTKLEGFSRVLDLDHRRAIASFRIEDAKPAGFSAEIPDLRIAGLLSSAKIVLHGRGTPAGKVELALSAEPLQVTIPREAPLLLDEAAVTVTNRQDRSLDVSMFALRQGSVKLWGDGRIGVDGRNRLSGKIATATNDIDGLLKAGAPYLRMDDRDRAAVKIVLGLFGKEIKADLIARNGELYWGPLKLADLTPLF